MKHKITRTKIKSIHFHETLCVKKRRKGPFAVSMLDWMPLLNYFLENNYIV